MSGVATAMKKAERASEVVSRLARAYPAGHPARPDTSVVGAVPKDPLEECVFTLLSQHTSDLNRDRAWVALRIAFPTWEALASAPVRKIADAIRSGGLADSKAPRIKALLLQVHEREGSYTLNRLNEMTDQEAAAYLTTLPGVGPKTAACVLAFSMKRAVLPIDTHVHRVGLRLGLMPAKTDATAAQPIWERLVPPRKRVATHIRLIAHGRSLCTAQRPACDRCLLADLCPSAAKMGKR